MIEQQRDKACYWQFPSFVQFPEIAHGVFTRAGGYSEGYYEGLNVAYSSGDEAEHVMRNRFEVLKSLGLETYPCATLWLTHGADVVNLDDNVETWEDWRADWPYRSQWMDGQEMVWTVKARRKADALITRRRGVALVMAYADCVPLLFYDRTQGAIGIAHAGWRGTARGMAAATVDAMREHYGCRVGDIAVGIGPAIGACCYEVSEQVKALFYGREQFAELPTAARYREMVRESAVFSECEKAEGTGISLRLDLWETNRRQLLLAGIAREQIEMADICTGCNTGRFFSHRVEQGRTGRFPVVMALRRK